MSDNVPHPEPFFAVRVRRVDIDPRLVGVCAGYEEEKWRCEQLAAHLIKWLPEFVLTHREREAVAAHNAVEMVYRAAQAVYTTNNSASRGEIGELLLHVILREVFDTVPAISKFFFKDSANDTVKGFDAVHVVATAEVLELWLGEVKFYEEIGSAITAVIKEVEKHSTRDYLRGEFAAIVNKIDPGWPHADRLRKLLHPNTSLDEVFDQLTIPILLTYNSHTMTEFKSVSAEFEAAFSEEISRHWQTFRDKLSSPNIRLYLFLFPMKSKGDLVASFDRRLKACQVIG